MKNAVIVAATGGALRIADRAAQVASATAPSPEPGKDERDLGRSEEKITFGAGLAFRHVRWPRALTWLRLISCPVYLLHPLVIEVYHHFSWTRQHHSFPLQVLLAAGVLAIVLALSSLTYLFVERPMQNVGRRVGATRPPSSSPFSRAG